MSGVHVPVPEDLLTILRGLRDAGCRGFIAGGAVRDALLGLEPKDFDVEVYGCSYTALADALSKYGPVDTVGKSFGVVKLFGSLEHSVDFSLPRRESKTGPGHRDFFTEFDPSITPREAAARRDFTINSMLFDPLNGELLDAFGGTEDLRGGILRATSSAFSEDPLRVLRGMQFACRFDLEIEPETAAMCASISGEYGTLARERVAEEWMKWAVKARRPGRVASYLNATGWDKHFPEIAALDGVPQDPHWHPEGDVGTHTMHVVNAAAKIAERERLDGDTRAVLLFSALAHDFAKPPTTQLRERDGRMRWTSWGHEEAGGPMARAFLERIGIKGSIVAEVVPLIVNHLAASHLTKGKSGESGEITPRVVRRLALRLAPANIRKLVWLIEADYSGRPPLPTGIPEGARRILEAAERQAVEQHPQAALILGRHVLPYFQDRPGKHIGQVVRAATEAQADGEFSTEEEALAWLARRMSPFTDARST